ncbi:amidohydrolase [Agrococcus sp. 1P02AA]|uniref:amidohydrolase n=1 Tax=Agrococcus sp. 1P02AA TaxID=3132259 RepID=UPI0039A61B49
MRTLPPPEAHNEHPLLITAQRIRTMAESDVATAMLVVDGRIAAIGAAAEVERAALEHPQPERIDLGDVTVVPGFVDAHAHPLMLGQLSTWVDCGPAAASDIPGIVALLRAAADRLPPGTPVRGYGYEQRNLTELRHPTRFELDEVAADREVYLMNASGHGGVVNSWTLERNGVTRDTPNPEGGEFFRDAEGELTGELSDAACNVLTGLHGVKIGHHGPNFHLGDEPAELVRQLEGAQARFLAGGVTAIGDAQVTKRELDTYLRLAEAGGLTMRVSGYLLSHLLEAALELGLHGPLGNARLSIQGIKLYADGTLGGETAWFPDGYLDDPCRTGQLYHQPEEYRSLVSRAHAVGLQTATHSQSPDALEMVIAGLEAALAERPDADARHRIEHCGLPTPEQIQRMATAGIIPVNQPQHHFNWGEGVTRAIGTPGERFNPLGELARAGIPLVISSDAPVADPKPLEAVQAAASRITRRGVQLGGDELAIGVELALRAHTINAARALGRERDLGSLELGKAADFAVLAADPVETPVRDIADIDVLATWVGGVEAHRADPHRADAATSPATSVDASAATLEAAR